MPRRELFQGDLLPVNLVHPIQKQSLLWT